MTSFLQVGLEGQTYMMLDGSSERRLRHESKSFTSLVSVNLVLCFLTIQMKTSLKGPLEMRFFNYERLQLAHHCTGTTLKVHY